MSRTNRFARELYKSLNQKRTGYEWEIGVPPCENRECVDVIGENGNKCVLVEVELRGTAPGRQCCKDLEMARETASVRWEANSLDTGLF